MLGMKWSFHSILIFPLWWPFYKRFLSVITSIPTWRTLLSSYLVRDLSERFKTLLLPDTLFDFICLWVCVPKLAALEEKRTNSEPPAVNVPLLFWRFERVMNVALPKFPIVKFAQKTNRASQIQQTAAEWAVWVRNRKRGQCKYVG